MVKDHADLSAVNSAEVALSASTKDDVVRHWGPGLHIFPGSPIAAWITPTERGERFVRRVMLEEGADALAKWEPQATYPQVKRLLFHEKPVRDVDLDLLRANAERISFRRFEINADILEEIKKEIESDIRLRKEADVIQKYVRTLCNAYHEAGMEHWMRPSREQLAVRMMWEKKVRELLSNVSTSKTGRISRRIAFLLTRARFSRRAAFESFLINVVAHESEPLAAEQSWVPHESIAWPPHGSLLGYQDIKSLVGKSGKGNPSVQACADKNALNDFFEKRLLGWRTRATKEAIYEVCTDIVAHSVLMRDTKSRELKAPARLGTNIPQRQDFLRIFAPREMEGEGFPHKLKKRFEDFLHGFCSDSEFSPGWQTRLAETDKPSDTKVFLGIALLDFVYPELRRIPPYSSLQEESLETEVVANAYKELMNWFGLYMKDFPFRHDEFFLAIGSFIKSVFRYRGRKEMTGWWQRFRFDYLPSLPISRIMQKFTPYTGHAESVWTRQRDNENVSGGENDSLMALLKQYAIAPSWFTQADRPDYFDGPFFIFGIFCAPLETMLVERVTALMVNVMRGKYPDAVFGVGKRGTFCASLVSLLTGTPLSSITLRSKFDISPRASRGRTKTALILDDCIKTGYTLYHALMCLRSDEEPSCRAIRRIPWFAFCRVEQRDQNDSKIKEVNDCLKELDTVQSGAKFTSEDEVDFDGSMPYLDISQDGSVTICKESQMLPPNEREVAFTHDRFCELFKSASRFLDNLGEEALKDEVLDITAKGLCHDYHTVPAEFKSRFIPFRWIQSILANEDASSFVCWLRRKFWRLFWEQGAKYKPELLFRHPKDLLVLGVYFHRKLQDLPEIDRPYILIANTRLSIPLAVAIALACRYDKNTKIKYRIVLTNEDGSHISGLSGVLASFENAQKSVCAASVTNITTFGLFETALAGTLRHAVEKSGIQVRKTATCSLFDVMFLSEDAERDKEVFGKFIPLIQLPRSLNTYPATLLKLIPKLDSFLESVNNINELQKLALVCLTHHEGLQYNRALIVKRDVQSGNLEVELGIGPKIPSDAEQSWKNVPPLEKLSEMAKSATGLDFSSFWKLRIQHSDDCMAKENSFFLTNMSLKEEGIARYNCERLLRDQVLPISDRKFLEEIGSPKAIMVCRASFTDRTEETEARYIVVDRICLQEQTLFPVDECIVQGFSKLLGRHIQRCKVGGQSDPNFHQQSPQVS